MRQQPADRDVRLAPGRELGPVAGRRLVEIQLAPLREQVRADRGGGLGGRVHELERVRSPGAARRGVGQAAPQVDHLAAAVVHADRRPHVTVPLEVAAERVPDPFEARRHLTAGCHHRNSSPSNAPDARHLPMPVVIPAGLIR